MPNPIDLGIADTFAVIAGTEIINSNSLTTLVGDMAVTPGTLIEGFPPGTLTGTTNINNNTAAGAQNNLTLAFESAGQQAPTQNLTGRNLGGMVLVPGVYRFDTQAIISGTLVLDAQHNLTSTAVWIFQIGSTLTTADSSAVQLINGAIGKNVFWQVGFSATLGSDSHFIGTLMAFGGITANIGAEAQGGLLAINGGVSLDDNHVESHFNNSATGGDPHVICLDGSRIDIYEPGFYRLFDNCPADDERIVVNADVRRNEQTFDYYNQIWINIKNDKSSYEYLIKFTQEGLYINDSQELVPLWEYSYKTHDNIRYIFKCEAKYNTVLLSTNDSKEPTRYSGLMAGIISPLDDLKDMKATSSCIVYPQYYDQNALLAGSAGPHTITAQKTSLRIADGWFRLLQWETQLSLGVINVYLDKDGRARELMINYKNGEILINDLWKWTGDEHWNLIASINNNVVDRHHVQEYHFILDNKKDTNVLLRVQGNGSLSASFRKVKSHVRGLFFEDIIAIGGPNDLYTCDVDDPIMRNYNIPQVTSIYQRLLDPMAT